MLSAGPCARPFTSPPPSSQASERIGGLGEQRFGRRSLKSELMSQILAGVHTQMVNMKEEEILVKIGEKTREASATPEINKQARDESERGAEDQHCGA